MSVQNLKAQFSKNAGGSPLSPPGTSFLHRTKTCSPQNALKPTPTNGSVNKNVNNISKNVVNINLANGNHVTSTVNGSVSPVKTQIPVSRFSSRLSNDNFGVNCNSSDSAKIRMSPDTEAKVDPSMTTDKWLQCYEEAEKKRKALQTENQKYKRDFESLEKKFKQLQESYKTTQEELQSKNEQLTKLTKLSEGVYKEYDQLKHQYDMETSAMQKAMEKAHLWYRQNRELKRRSTMIYEKVMQFAPDHNLEWLGDETDNNEQEADEMKELQKSLQELRKQIALLQTELSAAKLQEFEAQEQLTQLTVELEKEKVARIAAEEKLKERLHLQNEDQLEILEEKLRLAETELECALQRAIAAEKKIEEIEGEQKQLAEVSVPLPPPPPPPPLPPAMMPPPPPPPPLPVSSGVSPVWNQIRSKISSKQEQSESNDETAVLQMANLLGIPKKPTRPVQGVAIDDLINEIKGGKFNLRSTEKQANQKKKTEEPPVVQEMMTVLGTLRRRQKNSTASDKEVK